MNHWVTLLEIYGLSIILSWLLIRLGFFLDDAMKEKSEKEINEFLNFWFLMMWVPIVNIVAPVICIIGILGKKKNTTIFLRHFFLGKNKSKK